MYQLAPEDFETPVIAPKHIQFGMMLMKDFYHWHAISQAKASVFYSTGKFLSEGEFFQVVKLNNFQQQQLHDLAITCV